MASSLLSRYVVMLLFASGAHLEEQCSRQDYINCVKMADPMLTDPNLIFPDKMPDIDDLCRKWRNFVQCVKSYTSRCFTETQQQEFIKAVESPVDLVHQMCTETQYQSEYLQHATCIQSTITHDGHCSQNYRQLVGQVLGVVNENNLCCSLQNFRECVLSEVRRACSNVEKDNSASKFTREILDKSLSFIQSRCNKYEHNEQDCLSQTLTPGRKEILNRTQTNSNNNNDPMQHQRSTNTVIYNQNPHQPQAPDDKNTMQPWIPGHNSGPMSSRNQPPQPPNVNYAEESLHSNQRHSSYGRGINWTAPSPPSLGSQSPINPSGQNTWRVMSNNVPPTYTTEPWYPSIPNNGGKMYNSIDEPNQQGLANSKASSGDLFPNNKLYFLAMCALCFCANYINEVALLS